MGSKTIDSLFTYGTLMQANKMTKIIGRIPPNVPAVIKNYSAFQLKNRSYPGLLPSNQQTAGILYQNITPAEFELLDEYEGDEYRREVVTIKLNDYAHQSFCYLFKPELTQFITNKIWIAM